MQAEKIQGYEWGHHIEAEKWLYAYLEDYKARNPAIADLEKELLEKTSTRFFDWIDHIKIEASDLVFEELQKLGFEEEEVRRSYRIFSHPGAKFPSLVISEDLEENPEGLAVKVDSIADFLMLRGLNLPIDGSLFSPYRRAIIAEEGNVFLLAIERRGSKTIEPTYLDSSYLENYLNSVELWQTRSRTNGDESLEEAIDIAEEMVSTLGKDIAAHIVLECERRYWQAKNLAGTIQKYRQDRLGMGWANHDHHTFRSSRTYFADLVHLFEMLGFTTRERYYAGEEAGWGAQIMENPTAGLVLFLDVDLGKDEIGIDFAHETLPEKKELGTVGLWCGLHGDSILDGGMHHLEAQFEFERLREDLAKLGIGMMNPFTDFPYLRQAFTQAEMWRVDPAKLQHLLEKGWITQTQAEKFGKEGAVGSHLENLQRHQGYKGFNKKGVSQIMRETNPLTLKAST